jgi:hypothetical protein
MFLIMEGNPMDDRVKTLLCNIALELDEHASQIDAEAKRYTNQALRLNVLAVKLRAAVAAEAEPA